MKKLYNVIALLLFFASGAIAQTTTSVTGTVKDVTGTPIVSGKITFQFMPGPDATISGSARFSLSQTNCAINQPQISTVSRAANVVTATLSATPTQPFSIGDVVNVTGVTDTSFNGTGFTLTNVAGGGVTLTWSQTAGNASSSGGFVGGVLGKNGTGVCTLATNTALQPPGSYYVATVYAGGVKTSQFNFPTYLASQDISTTVPTPATAPFQSFVDVMSNQTIGGNKNFTGAISFQSGFAFGSSGVMGWSSNVDPRLAAIDSAISRIAAGVLGAGNGTPGDVSGTYKATVFLGASANPATAGVLRGASGDSLVCFRNNANGANVCLKKTGALASPFPADTLDLTDFGGAKAAQLFATGSGGQSSSSFIGTANGSPGWALNSTGGAADQKWMDCFLNTTTYACRFVNDAGNTANAFMTVSRGSGAAVGTMTFGAGGFVQTLPSATGTLARTSGDTFTSTTLTSPVINGSPTGTGIPTITLKKGSGGGNYTSASTTYVVVDATNLCYTVTIPTGWKLAVQSQGSLGTSTAAVSANIALTDNAACSTANAGVLVENAFQTVGAGATSPFNLVWAITGDGASHNIALQFKTSNGADSALLANSSATFLPTMVFLLTPSN